MTVPAGLFRRLAATFYDALLLFAVLFFATALLLPFTAGEAIRPHHPLYTAYLAGVAYLYFGWFWTHGGQTLGMRAWRLRLVGAHGGPPTWADAGARCLAAILAWLPLGAGYLWMLFDRDGLAWHDRLSGTVVVKE